MELASETSLNAASIFENTKNNLRDSFKLALNMAPSLMTIGSIGIILAKYTPVFDMVGNIFYPFIFIVRIPDSLLAAKSLSMSIVEMFLPVVPVAQSSLITRFVVGITCVSEILFCSASIPCMLSTDIPLKTKDYFIVWFERVAISILITAPIAYFFFS